MYDRCKRLIWLNPEPRNSWNVGDSEMAEIHGLIATRRTSATRSCILSASSAICSERSTDAKPMSDITSTEDSFTGAAGKTTADLRSHGHRRYGAAADGFVLGIEP